MFKAFVCGRYQLIEELSHGGDGLRIVYVFEERAPSGVQTVTAENERE